MPKNHPSSVRPASIELRGARQNNLRGFDLSLPLGKLIVVSGPSGSGKSSLAFETLYAEGQRRYVETFSPYTRQFFERMDKPAVDEIRGIPPAIAIEQVNAVKSTRSTVGTMTDINDYLKLLLPRVVLGHCPLCQQQVVPATPASIGRAIEALGPGALLITFPLSVPPDACHEDFLSFLTQQGYQRFWHAGEVHRTDAPASNLPPEILVIQDRIAPTAENRTRLSEGLEAALRLGKGRMRVVREGMVHAFATGWHCTACENRLPEPTPARFSFNHPQGACAKCRGFGRIITLDLARAIPDTELSLEGGAVKPFQTESGDGCQRDLLRLAAHRKISTKKPFSALSDEDQKWILQGDDPAVSSGELEKQGRWYGVRGYFDWLESRSYKMHVRVQLSRYRSYVTCPDCQGGRFAPDTLNFRWKGHTAPQILGMPVDELHTLVREELGTTPDRASKTSGDSTTRLLLEEIESRLRYLREVGLGYLTLDRSTRSLSGGEVARVNLTTCLGTALVNTLFVLDEPSIGLHARDTERLLGVLERLRDRGNTLVVVEHDEAIIRAADHLVEIGPGRGEAGGEIMHAGPLAPLLTGKKRTLTGDYLTGKRTVSKPRKRRRPTGWIHIGGASAHNLCEVTVDFPLGVLAGITGVSGSGKSSLVHRVLYPALAPETAHDEDGQSGTFRRIRGAENVEAVVLVDQSPLSRTPRSSPALYLGIFDVIRQKFASTEAACAAGLAAGAFSFNSGAGRCDRCGGSGFEKIEMQFLSDVFVRCPDCEGRRYQPHVRKVLLGGKSIDQVLELTVSEAIAFGEEQEMPGILGGLRVLEQLGLSYLRLGQPLNGLSGGESQRLKLAERLIQKSGGPTLFLLDEPTTGLHLDDISLLLRALHQLVEEGHSVLLIEHQMDVIRACDYLIDLGPGAGSQGGRVVVAGTPEEVARCKESYTGRFLAGTGVPSTVSPAPEPRKKSLGGIEIQGARHHNLQNLSVRIPSQSFSVVTGLSGSGKSTLAFDLLFAEGQRRFLDSMSPYARQFVAQMERPEVDRISGLPPTVAIEQRLTRGGGKSTVATVTEVYHFLRLLFSKVGRQHCPDCGVCVEAPSLSEALRKAADLCEQGAVRVLAPMIKARKGFHGEVATWALKNGFTELLVDGVWEKAARFPKLDRYREHTLELLVGTLEAKATASQPELRATLTRALEIGKGTAFLLSPKGARTIVSTQRSCTVCSRAFEELDPRMFSFNSPHGWCPRCTGFGEVWRRQENPRLDSQLERELEYERQNEALEAEEATPCRACQGARLNPSSCAVKIGARSIPEITAESARGVLEWVQGLCFSGEAALIARDILPEITQRLLFLEKVGLGYLHLNRSAKTLSGGESQRIRLAAQLGSNLRGVLYVLDEPTIGLHPRDNQALLDTLAALKEKGNSLVVVEHDEDTLRRADHIIDLGPGAGRHGGRIVAEGSLADIAAAPNSATGACLRSPLKHPLRGERRSVDGPVVRGKTKSAPVSGENATRWIVLSNASLHNVQGVDLRIPVNRLTVLSGISGSGKSTLMRGLLKPAVTAALARSATRPKEAAAAGGASRKQSRLRDRQCGVLEGAEWLEAVYEVDQSPIGKTSRSTPATYLGIFDQIRNLFAGTPLARIRGYEAGRFSFNTAGGRCETCMGQGFIRLEMNFLPPAHVLCSECGGTRYNASTLEVRYQDRSIAEVMAMPMEEAASFFAAHPSILHSVKLLCETGLGYLSLGQPSQTLSGGEAQRLKLVTELARGVGRVHHLEVRRNQRAKSALYLLEEPTIGLHMADVRHLLEVLHRLVDAGNTVVVIEHHPAVIAEADHIVEVGPEAGEHGGRIVAEGTPERLAELGGSRIGPFLRDILLRSGGVGTACLPAAANRAGESAARRKKGIRK